MKYQVSAMDLHFLVQELRGVLDNARADKLFQPDKKEFLLTMHVTGKGKHMLRFKLPNFIYLTDFKGEMPEKPKDFALVLRKYISGAWLREINQFGFERIIEFVFENKTAKSRIILEFFSTGNIILADLDYNIKSVLVSKKWKDRTLRGNVKYEYPKRKYNPLEMSEAEFIQAVDESEKESIVKALAIDLGLGGLYAEELCERAVIHKDRKDLKDDEKKALYRELKNLISSKISARYIPEKAIIPIEFKSIDFKSIDFRPAEGEGSQGPREFKSFSEALDSVLTLSAVEEEAEKKLAPYKRELARLEKLYSEQKEQIDIQQKEINTNQEKGEVVYNNFQMLENLLKELRDIVSKHPQKDIKEKLKGHKVIKEINFKDKQVTVEI